MKELLLILYSAITSFQYRLHRADGNSRLAAIVLAILWLPLGIMLVTIGVVLMFIYMFSDDVDDASFRYVMGYDD